MADQPSSRSVAHAQRIERLWLEYVIPPRVSAIQEVKRYRIHTVSQLTNDIIVRAGERDDRLALPVDVLPHRSIAGKLIVIASSLPSLLHWNSSSDSGARVSSGNGTTARKELAAEGDISETLLDFIRHHQAWAPAIVFVLAFGESLAFVSLLLPATAILLGVGGLIAAANIAFWPIWWAAALGAALGDWFSYWLGDRFSYAIARIWPLSRHPDLLPRGRPSSENGARSACSSAVSSVRCVRSCRSWPAFAGCGRCRFRSPILRRPSSGRRACSRRASWLSSGCFDA